MTEDDNRNVPCFQPSVFSMLHEHIFGNTRDGLKVINSYLFIQKLQQMHNTICHCLNLSMNVKGCNFFLHEGTFILVCFLQSCQYYKCIYSWTSELILVVRLTFQLLYSLAFFKYLLYSETLTEI